MVADKDRVNWWASTTSSLVLSGFISSDGWLMQHHLETAKRSWFKTDIASLGAVGGRARRPLMSSTYPILS